MVIKHTVDPSFPFNGNFVPSMFMFMLIYLNVIFRIIYIYIYIYICMYVCMYIYIYIIKDKIERKSNVDFKLDSSFCVICHI